MNPTVARRYSHADNSACQPTTSHRTEAASLCRPWTSLRYTALAVLGIVAPAVIRRIYVYAASGAPVINWIGVDLS